jgi:hypothetical protein
MGLIENLKFKIPNTDEYLGNAIVQINGPTNTSFNFKFDVPEHDYVASKSFTSLTSDDYSIIRLVNSSLNPESQSEIEIFELPNGLAVQYCLNFEIKNLFDSLQLIISNNNQNEKTIKIAPFANNSSFASDFAVGIGGDATINAELIYGVDSTVG